MNFILYSAVDESKVGSSLGEQEYSYYFLVKSFRHALAALGDVTVVRNPAREVDAIYYACRARGEDCLFLSFSPPNKTLTDLACPTVSVFAWEFSTFPNEVWDGDPRCDWRHVFAQHGRTVTLSNYAARTVQEAMGAAYPVLAVPTPLWDRYGEARDRLGASAPWANATLRFRGEVIDSAVLGLSADGLVHYMDSEADQDDFDEPVAIPVLAEDEGQAESDRPLSVGERVAALPGRIARSIAHRVRQRLRPVQQVEVEDPEIARLALNGVVYTSVLDPTDGRKNWFDIVTAFVWAFREVEDVTLVLKMSHSDMSHYRELLIRRLSELSPFKCRIVAIQAFLDDPTYEALIGATTYYVNASLCEGQCLPLMEFMCCGKPVIAPTHTAMADYIDEESAFVLRAGVEHNVWPNDPRQHFRALRYRIDWESLRDGYRASYEVAKSAHERYARMAEQAKSRMQAYCADTVVTRQIRDFFELA
jgi:glycosyltransferase involved in cell wall biosynthesis